MVEVEEPSTPPPRSPTTSLDLTRPSPPSSPSPFSPRVRSPFSSAYRRVRSRRERIYSRSNPDLLAERLDISEETPHSYLRDRASAHVSVAYACAGYAHAALCIVVCIALGLLVGGLGRGVWGDVKRKIRVREDEMTMEALECSRKRTENGCQVDQDGSVKHVTPALEGLCKRWVMCEKRGGFVREDAWSATVWAETLAEMLNAFAERITSTGVVLAVVGGVVVLFGVSSVIVGRMQRKMGHGGGVIGDVMAREAMARHMTKRGIGRRTDRKALTWADGTPS